MVYNTSTTLPVTWGRTKNAAVVYLAVSVWPSDYSLDFHISIFTISTILLSLTALIEGCNHISACCLFTLNERMFYIKDLHSDTNHLHFLLPTLNFNKGDCTLCVTNLLFATDCNLIPWTKQKPGFLELCEN